MNIKNYNDTLIYLNLENKKTIFLFYSMGCF